MLRVNEEFRRRAADRLALPMFCLPLAFLIIVAIMLVLLVDVQFLFTSLGGTADPSATSGTALPQIITWISVEQAMDAGYDCVLLLGLLWPFFLLELVFQFVVRDRDEPFLRKRYMSLIYCLCPPLRMCAHNYDMDGKIWFPSMGWKPISRQLRQQLEKSFSLPMIFIALAILPVLLIDLFMKKIVWSRPWLQIVLLASTGVIWFAFAAEFIVMVSVAEKKLKYCKEHWLDLAIILLPFISFLRALRVVRATRLARLAKIQQLSRMGRVYRMRGLMMRAVRALMILKLVNYLFRISPERQLRKLQAVLEEKELQIAALRQEIVELEKQVQEREGE